MIVPKVEYLEKGKRTPWHEELGGKGGLERNGKVQSVPAVTMWGVLFTKSFTDAIICRIGREWEAMKPRGRDSSL